jgi:DNA-binding MurR/RpiR family transcriptional regulator
VTATLESAPADATHWSTRDLAKRIDVSQFTVSRVWRAFDLQPHRVETFRFSNDLASIRRFCQYTLETQGKDWRTSDSGH